MPQTYYPPASREQWFGGAYPGSPIDPNCVVWHTTETGWWPGYGGGASAPHFTYNPATREFRQHLPVNRSARALRNESGGVETNTLNCVQIELVAYSDEVLAAHRGHRAVSDLRAEHLQDLGDWAKWLHDEWGIRLDIDPGWVTSNYVTSPPMSFSQWRGFYGHCGHNRVPENTHWDPARLDIWTIIDHAKGDDDMPTAAEIVDEMERRTYGTLVDGTQITGWRARNYGPRYAHISSLKLNDVRANQARELKLLAEVRAAQGGVEVDESALAAELTPLLAPLLVDELADVVSLTPDQVEAAQERVLRRVLGSLND